jgi:hypothetical protein
MGQFLTTMLADLRDRGFNLEPIEGYTYISVSLDEKGHRSVVSRLIQRLREKHNSSEQTPSSVVNPDEQAEHG